jgi:hypothetical protein
MTSEYLRLIRFTSRLMESMTTCSWEEEPWVAGMVVDDGQKSQAFTTVNNVTDAG